MTEDFDSVSEEEFEEIFLALGRFEGKKIDEFFYLTGWIEKERGENKAIPDFRIAEIKKGSFSGKNYARAMIRESMLSEMLKVLEDLNET